MEIEKVFQERHRNKFKLSTGSLVTNGTVIVSVDTLVNYKHASNFKCKQLHIGMPVRFKARGTTTFLAY